MIETKRRRIVRTNKKNNNPDVHLITKMAASISLMSDLVAMGSTAWDILSSKV